MATRLAILQRYEKQGGSDERERARACTEAVTLNIAVHKA